MTRRTPVRVAIAGAGLMGGWHADAARRAGARVTAVLDSDRLRAEHLASRLPDCRPVADLATAIGMSDIVHVCTPTPTHVPMVREILESRRHALVEKPLAPGGAQTAELLALAESRRVLLCPVHQFVFQQGVQAALTRLRELGPLRHADLTICSAGATGADDPARARIAAEILPHPLSLLQRVLDGGVADLDWTVQRPAAGEIRATAQAGDVTISILISMSGRPTTNRMRLIGAAGTIDVDLFHGFAAVEAGDVSRARKVAQPFMRSAVTSGAAAANLIRRAWHREPAYPGLRELLERFYSAVISGSASPISAADTLEVAQACDVITSWTPREQPITYTGQAI